jgi:hypothetical protein
MMIRTTNSYYRYNYLVPGYLCAFATYYNIFVIII